VKALPFVLLLACSPGKTQSGLDADAAPAMRADAGGPQVRVEVEVPCEDSTDAIYESAELEGDRGDILRCVREPFLSRNAMEQVLEGHEHGGRAPETGAHRFRVLYKTVRGNDAEAPGSSSAIVLLPKKSAASSMPAVVVVRGTVGQASGCAISRMPTQAIERIMLPIVGAGFSVIITDLAGYADYGAPDNPPPAYASAADEGHSTLDAARALKALLGDRIDQRVILVGHSQGGHAALAALAMAEDVAPGLTPIGVVGFAPHWLHARAFGAPLSPTALSLAGLNMTIADAPLLAAVTVWYHYTTAELLDGPGAGAALFAEDKRDAIVDFVESACYQSGGYPQLAALGEEIHELYDPGFASAVGLTAAGVKPCQFGTCKTWLDRYKAERPHLEGPAADVPLLFLYGAEDTVIPSERMHCAVNRLERDEAELEFCLDPEATHLTILSTQSDRAIDFMRHLSFGSARPASCELDQSALEGCPLLPPND